MQRFCLITLNTVDKYAIREPCWEHDCIVPIWVFVTHFYPSMIRSWGRRHSYINILGFYPKLSVCITKYIWRYANSDVMSDGDVTKLNRNPDSIKIIFIVILNLNTYLLVIPYTTNYRLSSELVFRAFLEDGY